MLGEYVILRKIGAGGMGQVFKARHRRMKRLVALKVLPASAHSERGRRVKRFQREVKAAARLTHPEHRDGLRCRRRQGDRTTW